jgi:hypothetical protein
MYLLEDTSKSRIYRWVYLLIIGKEKDAPLIIKYLEYTVLYRSKATGLGFSGRNNSGLGYAGEYKLKAIFNVFLRLHVIIK